MSNEHHDNTIQELRTKGLLSEKHKWESQPGRIYKAPPPTDEDGRPLREEHPACAVDLHAFRLDKPVVQKPGTHFLTAQPSHSNSPAYQTARPYTWSVTLQAQSNVSSGKTLTR